MKKFPLKPRAPLCLAAALLMALGASTAIRAQPLQAQVVLRPLTPQDIKDYGLPATTQVASGLSTVGLGVPVHLEAWLSVAVPASNIVDVAWNLANKPIGSAAALETSPLGANVPIYTVSDRLVSKLAGRTFLRPDVAGQYTVSATITTTTTNGAVTLSRTITAATYMGVNTCALCHSGGLIAPNMVAGWSETGHATKFSRDIDGHNGTTFSTTCFKCHTVGYDTNTNAVNGGFDDIVKQIGWLAPTNLTNGNWAATPQAIKNVANIQCENCHGPGSEHAFSLGHTNKISVSWNVGNCGQCHDSKSKHYRVAEWNNSKHAITTRTPTGANRSGCVGCHSGKGFVDRMDGLAVHNTDYEAIGCASCHDPHDATNPHQLRGSTNITLMDNITTVKNAGNGSICIQCHRSRRDAVTYVETTAGSGNFGPHENPQADMLVGANAVTYGKVIPSSAHRDVVKGACVACHMQSVASTNAFFGKVGGHTFNLAWDGGTSTNSADDIELVSACKSCHGSIDNFNFPRQDFDGDGQIEGVQTEVEGLMHELALLLPPIGQHKSSLTITTNWTRPQLRAGYNYKFVQYDGSHGVHNLSYAVGILKASIADLTDDADHDGLSDKWEIANFGGITTVDAFGDVDNDGVSNSLELAAGTNPKVSDTDGDGFSDLAEFTAGSDPLKNTDKPGLVVTIQQAGELEFPTETGKTYQIQMVSDFTTSWQTISTNIPGTGETISYLVSTSTGGAKEFYRVVQTP